MLHHLKGMGWGPELPEGWHLCQGLFGCRETSLTFTGDVGSWWESPHLSSAFPSWKEGFSLDHTSA